MTSTEEAGFWPMFTDAEACVSNAADGRFTLPGCLATAPESQSSIAAPELTFNAVHASDELS